jgi:hypothetical protein
MADMMELGELTGAIALEAHFQTLIERDVCTESDREMVGMGVEFRDPEPLSAADRFDEMRTQQWEDGR